MASALAVAPPVACVRVLVLVPEPPKLELDDELELEDEAADEAPPPKPE